MGGFMPDEAERLHETILGAMVRIREVFDDLGVDDLRRLHAKFVGITLALEATFERRYPDEWQAYERQFYGDDDA